MIRRPPRSPLFPSTPLFRSWLLQIGSAIGLSVLAAIAFGLPLNQGVFWGFLAAMSSTAVVLKMVTERNRKSTRLNSSHSQISYAVFCLKKKKKHNVRTLLRD